MLSHGSKSYEEVMEQVKERQLSYAGDLAKDKRRLENSHIREVKKRAEEAEKRYFHNLKNYANC
jgi:hypothetical protein